MFKATGDQIIGLSAKIFVGASLFLAAGFQCSLFLCKLNLKQ